MFPRQGVQEEKERFHCIWSCQSQISPRMMEKPKREIGKATDPKKKFLTLQEREKEAIENIVMEH